MIDVVIDIESTGKTHHSVFAVAICARFPSKLEESVVFYMHDDPNLRSDETMAWWESDPNRKKFLEKALIEGAKFNRAKQISEIRGFIDRLYSIDENLVFYSDFPVFDIGLLNSMFSELGLLPAYLKNDKSVPCSVVNYVMYLRGSERLQVDVPSSSVFKLAKINRPQRDSGHDPLVDVSVIMKEVQLVKDAVFGSIQSLKF